MAERVEASVTDGESTIEERDRELMREFEEGLDQPMDEEADMLKDMHREKSFSMLMLLRLSFQSLGIVYGDLGTSPLYVFYNTFPDGIDDSEDVIGALSLIIYSLLLIPLIKYVFIVCKANDNGQGGTLAIYSLLCRHANVNLIPNQQRSDEDLTTYSRTSVAEGSFAAKTKKWLESRHSKKRALLVIVLIGTCMMIGDGILTPAISGTAVVIVMLVTTLLMVLTMLVVWRCHWILVLIFALLSLVVELSYFSAVLLKINEGGWVPLIIAAFSLLVMFVWNYVTVKKYEFEVHSRVSMSWILGLGPSLGLVRVPGIGLVHTELASGVPHIFSHFITNLPAIHSVVVFVCVKNLPVYTVPEEERFLVKRIGPKTFRMFRCVARYGYKDLHRKDDRFEDKLFENLFSFIQNETMMESDSNYSNSVYPVNYTQESRDELISNNNNNHDSNDNNMVMFSSMVDYMDTMSFSQNNTVEEEEEEEDELEFLKTCKESGVVHIMGNTVVKARKGSLLPKKIAIDYVYAFLAKICRENSAILHVPHETLLNVWQVYCL
ncbi:hypothetical protein F2Q68_00037180 [Brassica cretica]|uniref:Potassium transporter n=1 Tax=Brassica cretica TaxID=69181 RepID=A0A8S9H4R4_BRACR|nr:hypothetical protein F2Q68_00037180 [Brassica cretica]